MRINSVLECFNSSLSQVRLNKSITSKGHFLATYTVEKMMGPFKRCNMKIYYANHDTQKTNVICGTSLMHRGDKEELVENTTKAALIEFFNFIYDNQKEVIQGSL